MSLHPSHNTQVEAPPPHMTMFVLYALIKVRSGHTDGALVSSGTRKAGTLLLDL